MSLIYLDVDFSRPTTTTHGHQAGDECRSASPGRSSSRCSALPTCARATAAKSSLIAAAADQHGQRAGGGGKTARQCRNDAAAPPVFGGCRSGCRRRRRLHDPGKWQAAAQLIEARRPRVMRGQERRPQPHQRVCRHRRLANRLKQTSRAICSAPLCAAAQLPASGFH